jgi:hypothetical protein
VCDPIGFRKAVNAAADRSGPTHAVRGYSPMGEA